MGATVSAVDLKKKSKRNLRLLNSVIEETDDSNIDENFLEEFPEAHASSTAASSCGSGTGSFSVSDLSLNFVVSGDKTVTRKISSPRPKSKNLLSNRKQIYLEANETDGYFDCVPQRPRRASHSGVPEKAPARDVFRKVSLDIVTSSVPTDTHTNLGVDRLPIVKPHSSSMKVAVDEDNDDDVTTSEDDVSDHTMPDSIINNSEPSTSTSNFSDKKSPRFTSSVIGYKSGADAFPWIRRCDSMYRIQELIHSRPSNTIDEQSRPSSQESIYSAASSLKSKSSMRFVPVWASSVLTDVLNDEDKPASNPDVMAGTCI